MIGRAIGWGLAALARANQARLRRWGRAEVVLLGDSITEQWLAGDPLRFVGGWLNAGIGGETTREMLARFNAEVAAFAPRVVHVMGGTNDAWHGSPGLDGADAIARLTAIAERALAAGIAVVLAAPPPIGREAAALFRHPEQVETIRLGTSVLAAARGLVHVDYAASLCDAAGALLPRFTTDGVHLTAAGYRAIRAQAVRAIGAALARTPGGE